MTPHVGVPIWVSHHENLLNFQTENGFNGDLSLQLWPLCLEIPKFWGPNAIIDPIVTSDALKDLEKYSRCFQRPNVWMNNFHWEISDKNGSFLSKKIWFNNLLLIIHKISTFLKMC